MNNCTNKLSNGETCNNNNIAVTYENNTVKAMCCKCGKKIYAGTPAEARIQWDLQNPKPLKVEKPKKGARASILDRVKKQELQVALTKSKGVKVHAAKYLGISTSSLRKLMKAYKL